MRLLLVAAIMALVTVQPAKAEESSACAGAAYNHTTDTLYQQQAGFYMGAYDSGAMSMEYMAHRLATYTQRYEGIEQEFASFIDARRSAGADFSKPVTFIRALGDFLASVEVDMHVAIMCGASSAKEMAKPYV